ncbi:MAG: peptidoglycan DD-metalloendopeptidase family protein [Saprospiraceae bacterium]|nr:peptidoglycan DD-metalloendopeptidase family protein [Saprospiraceae bacterium]
MRVSSVCLLLFFCGIVFGQTSRQLKAKREELLQDIQLTGKALANVRSQEKQTLEELLLLDEQVAGREKAIALISQELVALDKELGELQTAANQANQSRINALNTYRRLARYRLYYRLSDISPVLFLLASPHWNIAFQRMFLFDRLALRSREAARTFHEEEAQILRNSEEQKQRKTELTDLLSLESSQKKQILLESQERNNLLRQLQKDQQSLQSQQETMMRERQKLEEAIADLIRKEIAAEEARAKAKVKAKEGKKKPASSTTPARKELEESPASAVISGDFARNKGKLGWPVDRGVLVRPFGPQQHPSLPRVRTNNTGVDFRTEDAAQVKAVFAGEISGIQWVPGYANTMIIRHGQYYSVYSNMATVVGKKGDRVAAGTVVGTAAQNPVSGTAEIHFEIWKGKNRENPSHWLKKNK